MQWERALATTHTCGDAMMTSRRPVRGRAWERRRHTDARTQADRARHTQWVQQPAAAGGRAARRGKAGRQMGASAGAHRLLHAVEHAHKCDMNCNTTYGVHPHTRLAQPQAIHMPPHGYFTCEGSYEGTCMHTCTSKFRPHTHIVVLFRGSRIAHSACTHVPYAVPHAVPSQSCSPGRGGGVSGAYAAQGGNAGCNSKTGALARAAQPQSQTGSSAAQRPLQFNGRVFVGSTWLRDAKGFGSKPGRGPEGGGEGGAARPAPTFPPPACLGASASSAGGGCPHELQATEPVRLHPPDALTTGSCC